MTSSRQRWDPPLASTPGEHGVSLDDVVDLLLDKSPLIVIDNCEHVIDEAAIVVDAIYTNCARVHVLATSREALGLLDEEAVRVPALDDEHALTLLRRRASRIDGAAIRTEDEGTGRDSLSLRRSPTARHRTHRRSTAFDVNG